MESVFFKNETNNGNVTVVKGFISTIMLFVMGIVTFFETSGQMIETHWNQVAPYNQMCPLDRNGDITPPGCGAVAVGQILYYYGAPLKAFGSVDYTYKVVYAKGDTVECRIQRDFEEHPFDLENILDTYTSGSYSDIQADAVADYLYSIGTAMFMQYRKGGSSRKNDGSQIWGLHHHLHVSPDAMCHYRENYSTEQWRQMLDNELSNGSPVYYGASWYHYSTKGELVRVGHYFIIDGKNEDGTYHINWGNNNKGNAVDLEIMNQDGSKPFIGGAAVCYHTRQCMITGLVPAKEDASWLEQGLISTRPLILNDNKALEQITLGEDRKFIVQYGVQHYSDRGYENIHDGIGLFRQGEKDPFLIIKNPVWRSKLGAGYYLDRRREISLDSDLPEGEYIAYPMSENAVTGKWQRMLEGFDSKIDIKVDADGKVNVSVPHNYTGPAHIFLREPITEIDNPYGNLYPGKTLSMKISNSGQNNFQDSLRITIRPQDAPEVILPYYMSVYEGCDMDIQYLIPQHIVDLTGKDFDVEVEYYDSYAETYRTLGVGKESKTNTISFDEAETDAPIRLYGIDGQLIYNGPYDSMKELTPGIYILHQGKNVRKIIIQ